MIKIDVKDLKKMEADLKNFASRALPFATKNTVNQAAFTAMREAKQGVREDMTTRNRFTEQSIRVKQTKTLAISRQAATVGSVADYMEDQEFGATKTKTGKEGVAIPTSYSAGQGRGVKPRTRLPRKPNKMENIRLKQRSKGGVSRKQHNLVAIKGAAAGGNKYVFLDLGRRKGIFRVNGGKKNPKIQMVHDLTSQAVTIPRNPWLKPAVDRTKPKISEIYKDSLRFQLRRLRIFNCKY